MILCSMLLISFISCDSWLGVNITDERQMQELNKKILDYLPSEAILQEIKFVYADQRSPSIMGRVSIQYINPDKQDIVYIKTILLDEWKIVKDSIINKKNNIYSHSDNLDTGVRIGDYNFKSVPEIIRLGIEKLEENGLSYVGIEQFSIKFSMEQSVSYYLTILGKPQKSARTIKGKHSAIYYKEVQFYIDASGEWEMIIDEKLRKRLRGW